MLLRNEAAAGRRWVGVKLKGATSNRDGIGARMRMTVGVRTLTRWVTGGGSFLASNDRRVVFGLGGEGTPAALEIRWPSGRVQRVEGLVPGRYHEVAEPGE